jgi:RNA polymerase sigma-70 factor (ECF subfamily)
VRVDLEFEELYRREHGAVFRTVYALCGDRSAAEDATQEAFARALERWRRLRDRPWVAGWITATALNAARRAMRRSRPASAPQPRDGDLDRAADLWRVVRSLPRRQQEAVVLRYVADLPVAGVAAAMGCAEGTAKAHLARARAALRSQLEGVRDE